jgi:hypothetical protein
MKDKESGNKAERTANTKALKRRERRNKVIKNRIVQRLQTLDYVVL